MSRHVVAAADEIKPGGVKIVTVKGRSIGVFNVAGKYYALLNKCPHQGAELCRGRISGTVESDDPGSFWLSRKGEMVKCPWHGWEFDIMTGKSWCDPKSTLVKSFSVAVAPGKELVEGPFSVETFAISVDENYLIIEM
jgi:3-phenylpropionate/trans-cinnamate dioxygenase ferredoxin subunit